MKVYIPVYKVSRANMLRPNIITSMLNKELPDVVDERYITSVGYNLAFVEINSKKYDVISVDVLFVAAKVSYLFEAVSRFCKAVYGNCGFDLVTNLLEEILRKKGIDYRVEEDTIASKVYKFLFNVKVKEKEKVVFIRPDFPMEKLDEAYKEVKELAEVDD